jgi:flagellar hook assembly protein FlgD
MKKIVFLLMTLLCFLLPATLSEAEEIKLKPQVSKFNTESRFDETKDFEVRQLIVKFKVSVTENQKKEILDSKELTEISTQVTGNFTLVSIPKNSDLSEVAEDLLKHNQIEFVEPNYQVTNSFTPKDPMYSKQWHLKKIQASKAWDQTKGASSVIVAVIDGGVQVNHPDLKGKMVSPYNAVTGGTTFSPVDHGTHVAGIVAATLNKSGGTGVAPNVKIMPINVFRGSGATMYDVANAIRYAADHNADIINMSLGGYYYSYDLHYATEYAKSKGVLIVAAAGNDDSYDETYPASLDGVIGVSATDSGDEITDFSNYGNSIDFAAPGEDIYSTINGSKYGSMDGTSMASPVVAGVAALILSKNPLMTDEQVETVLQKSSVDLWRKGWDYFYGYGRVDAYKALQSTSSPISNITLSSASFTMTGSNKKTIAFSAFKGSKVSLYIQNSKGTTVKKLITNKAWSGGKVSSSWNGTLDNGTYAVGGTYKIVAKVNGNGNNVYKSAALKVVDKVVPSIKITGTAIYSPPVKGKLTIPYELNKNAKITAQIKDKNNKVIKTILNNTSVSAGKKSIVWDGKDSKGKKVSDGSYSLAMSVIDANKLKGTSRKFAITVDSSSPKGKTSSTPAIFKMDGAVKNIGKIDVNETVYMTAYVTTDKGVKIKKLINNKNMKKGALALTWDGKNDKKQFVAEGKYYYLIELRDVAGNKATVNSALFTLQDWNKPVIQGSSDFYYSAEGNASFPYTLSKPGKVTIQILENGTEVRAVELNVPKAKGKQQFVWDGKDQSGSLLNDGKYSYEISTVDAYQLTHTYTGNMHVDLTSIEVEYPTTVQWNYDETAEVYYKLSEQAKVTVEIYEGNTKIRTIMTDKPLTEGINSFKWDGYDDEDYLVYGDEYTYEIMAINNAGKTKTITGKITDDEYPEWLVLQEYYFTPSEEYSYRYSHLNLELTVTKPIQASLYVLDYYSEEIKDVIEYDLVKGINKLVYEKSDIWDDNYYLIGYTDSLGNEYYYVTDENSYDENSIDTPQFDSDVNRELVEQLN